MFRPKQRWGLNLSITIWVFLTLIIGLRHEVGGDWIIYIQNMERLEGLTFGKVILSRDPAYALLSWTSLVFNTGIYGVNLICSAIFSFGLVFFCREQPRPWLALCLAVPYLVIVVAMGYTRQGVSIGLLMPALLCLGKGKLKAFAGWVFLAGAFQQTSLVTLAFLLPAMPGRTLKIRLLKFLIMSIVAYGFINLFLISQVEAFIDGYIISQQMQSEGAAIRVAMNAIPGFLFLVWGKSLSLPTQEYHLWLAISALSLDCVAGLKLIPSSTVVDRIALYAIPIQLFVGSSFPDMRLLRVDKRIIIFSIVAYAVSIQFVWLFFAKTAFAWLPYQNILLK